MQTLVFNTTDKTVKLYEGINEESKLVYAKKDITRSCKDKVNILVI